MSGNLWMFSDKLDDEDIEIMKHEFITYYQGADYYGLGLKMVPIVMPMPTIWITQNTTIKVTS